jgi:hypothetical protein
VSRFREWVVWSLCAWIAFIFVSYLRFKFSGSAGSVHLFTVLTDWLGLHGHERLMRLGTGSAELLAAILLFDRKLQVFGAGLSLGIMSGAIFFHLISPLHSPFFGEGGMLFREACLVWLAAAIILAIRWRESVALSERFLPFLPLPSGIAAAFPVTRLRPRPDERDAARRNP